MPLFHNVSLNDIFFCPAAMEPGHEHMQVVAVSDDEEDDGIKKQAVDPWKGFDMPYCVATVEEHGQRAYFDHQSGIPEWLWSRVHYTVKIKKEPGRVLGANEQKIHEFFSGLEIGKEELLYRGKNFVNTTNAKWKDHTLMSRGLLGMLLWIVCNRPLKANAKSEALRLLQGMVKVSFQHMCSLHGTVPEALMMLLSSTGTLVCESLELTQQGFSSNWGTLLGHCPSAQRLWEKLRRSTWCGFCISTSLQQASLEDIWFFLAFICAHRTFKVEGQVVWLVVGKVMLPTMIQLCGSWLDSLALTRSQYSLKELPMLKSRLGNATRILDPVNRMLMLFRVRREKVHRRRVGMSHESLVPLQQKWMRHEDMIDVILHCKMLQETFNNHPKQISITWDPGNYGGKSTNVICFFSNHLSKGGFLLNQQVAKLMQSDVDDELVKLAKNSRLSRLDGYNELRSMASSLFQSCGFSLSDFQVPAGLLVMPLKEFEVRVKGRDKMWYVFNTKTKEARPQLPPGQLWEDIPILVSVSDQGPSNMASLNFLAFSNAALMISCQFDMAHRTWNDIKNSAKRTSFKAWKAILELVVFFNVNFGPYGSQQWWYRKRAFLEEFLSSQTIHSESWGNFQHLICQELHIEEPDNEEDQNNLLQSMSSLSNFVCKGPLVKLMRWMSFFECCQAWAGEMYATRMVMEHGLKLEGDEVSEDPPDEGLESCTRSDPKLELQELKKRKGTFRLAPTLVHPKNMIIKDILMSVSRATWKMHAQRVKDVKSPDDHVHFLAFNTGQQQRWKDELVAMVHNSLSRQETLAHLNPAFCSHPSGVEWQVEYFQHLLETRAMSLISFYGLPPMKYSHVLSQDLDESKAASRLACSDLKALLNAERAATQMTVKPLNVMFWAKNPLTRSILFTHEFDLDHGCQQSKKLHTVLSRTFGDTRSVENSHQHARDLLRSSKNSTFGNVKIMANPEIRSFR